MKILNARMEKIFMFQNLINFVMDNMKYSIYYIIGFLPFILMFLIIEIKLFMGKVFNNKIFYATLILLLIWLFLLIYIPYTMTEGLMGDIIPSSFSQTMNMVLGQYLYFIFPYIIVLSVILIIIFTSIAVIGKILLKKEKISFRYLYSIMFIIITLYFMKPFMMIGLFNNEMALKNRYEFFVYKKAMDVAVLPPVKHYIMSSAVIFLNSYMYDEIFAQKFPDFKSEKLRQLIKVWRKYTVEYAKLDGTYNYIMNFFTALDLQDEEHAEYILKKLDEANYNTDFLKANLYIYRGDYDNSLKYLNKLPSDKKGLNKLYGIVFIKNKDYNKALYYAKKQKEEDEKNSKKSRFYINANIYILYKTGKKEQAQKLYSQLKDKRINNSYNYSLDDYIKYLEIYKLMKL